MLCLPVQSGGSYSLLDFLHLAEVVLIGISTFLIKIAIGNINLRTNLFFFDILKLS